MEHDADHIDLSKIPLAGPPQTIVPPSAAQQQQQWNHHYIVDDPQFQRKISENLRKQQIPLTTDRSRMVENVHEPFSRLVNVDPDDTELKTNDITLRCKNPENSSDEHNHNGNKIIVWPPINERERLQREKEDASRHIPQSIFHAQKRAEYERQKAQELEAMLRHKAEVEKWSVKQEAAQRMQKLIRLKKLEQAKQQEMTHRLTIDDEDDSTPNNAMSSSNVVQSQNTVDLDENWQSLDNDKLETPNFFKTRPASNGRRKWRYVYALDEEPPVEARNEIISSSDLLKRDFNFDIDLLQRREAFIEKIEPPPKINYVGRRWQPPEDVSPRRFKKRTILSAQNSPESCQNDTKLRVYSHSANSFYNDFAEPNDQEADNSTNESLEALCDEFGEYRWLPVTHNAEFRHEKKNFTPQNSPIDNHNYNLGFGELEAASKRQLRDLIVPKYDGSHRPTPLFLNKRHPPAGGFYPHAPNAVQVIKRHLPTSDSSSIHALQNGVRQIQIEDEKQQILNSPHSSSNDVFKSSEVKPIIDNLSCSNTPLRQRYVNTDGTSHQSDISTIIATQSEPVIISRHRIPVHSSTITSDGYSHKLGKSGNSKRGVNVRQRICQIEAHAKRQKNELSKRRPYFKSPNPPPIPPHQNNGHKRSSNTNGRRSETKLRNQSQTWNMPVTRPYVPPALPPDYRSIEAATQPKTFFSANAYNTAENEELDKLARLSREIAQRSKSRRVEYKVELPVLKTEIPQSPAAPSPRWSTSLNKSMNGSVTSRLEPVSPAKDFLLKCVSTGHSDVSFPSELSDSRYANNKQRYSYASTMRSLLREEPPSAPPVVRTVVQHEPPVRHEVVEVRREVKPKVTQNVQRFEERKRTEEVERRIIRRERRHKSSRIRYGHHNNGYSGQQQQEFHDWNGRGLRSSSAASRNGYGSGGGGDYYYHSYSRHGGGDAASDRFYHRGADQARFGGSVSDSLRRGDLKYGPNGDVREHGTHNGNTSEKYNSTRRVHKSYSTRDIYGGGGSSHSYGTHQPVVEFPPTLPRHGTSQQNGYYGAPAPPPHRQNGFHTDYYSGGGYGNGRLTKSRSYADWGDGGRGPFGNSIRRYDDDMARLENEFRDSLLMKLPTNGGNMNEKDYRHEQIPGGYETYEREVKASSGRKYHPSTVPTDFKESSHAYNFKRETQR